MPNHRSAAPPLVSVVTPSFNQARFIEETLASVFHQDYRPIEHIVIDGASTDGSVEVLRRWAEAHNDSTYKLTWISEPDRGMGDGINKGFDRVSGEIVGWLNSDDVYFDRQVIRSAVDAFRSDPAIDAVHGDVALISEDGGLWMIWCFPEFRYQRALHGYLIPQPTVFLRKYVTDDVRIDLDLPVAHDTYLWLLAGKKYRFKHVHRIQAGDREHSGRKTHEVEQKWAERRAQMYRSFGGTEHPGAWTRNCHRVIRMYMRLKGTFRLVKLFGDRHWRGNLVFPMWIDSPWAVFRRQATMRIMKRPPLSRTVSSDS